jgi:hypothetical protein
MLLVVCCKFCLLPYLKHFGIGDVIQIQTSQNPLLSDFVYLNPGLIITFHEIGEFQKRDISFFFVAETNSLSLIKFKWI